MSRAGSIVRKMPAKSAATSRIAWNVKRFASRTAFGVAAREAAAAASMTISRYAREEGHAGDDRQEEDRVSLAAHPQGPVHRPVRRAERVSGARAVARVDREEEAVDEQPVRQCQTSTAYARG
jgi:hypothetical protein